MKFIRNFNLCIFAAALIYFVLIATQLVGPVRWEPGRWQGFAVLGVLLFLALSSLVTVAASLMPGFFGIEDDTRNAPQTASGSQIQKTHRSDKKTGLTLGDAIEAAKHGSRIGWNGKGLFVYFVAWDLGVSAQTGVAKEYFGDGALVPCNAYLVIKNVDGTVSTWAPSVSDSLGNDWYISTPTSAMNAKEFKDAKPDDSLPLFQQRVIQEKSELDGRIEKLRKFSSAVFFEGLPDAEKSRLASQIAAMTSYSEILGVRISAFKDAK